MKGKSGAVRMKSLDASGLAAMGRHEKRLDYAGSKRAIRDVPPLVYSPYGEGLDLEQSYTAHVEGTKRNKGGRALARHGFLQFPTDLPVTPENEQRMLDEAVAFINATHGGRAVFRARLDRDEAGQHGVDVFFAPKYEKTTRRGKVIEDWISLSKFGKKLALERFGERQKKEKNPDSGLFELVFDKAGQPVMERCDSPVFQGRALQDLWTGHLRDGMGLEWVERGKVKVGRDPDRLEPEEYKITQERGKLESAKADLVGEMEAREAALAAKTRELNQREQEITKKEQKTADYIEAVARDDIRLRLVDGKIQPRMKRSLPEERKAELMEAVGSFSPAVREILRATTSLQMQAREAKKATNEAVIKAMQAGSDAFYRREIIGAEEAPETGWKIHYSSRLTEQRRGVLSAILEPFREVVAPFIATIAQAVHRWGVTAEEVAEERNDSGWDYGPGM